MQGSFSVSRIRVNYIGKNRLHYFIKINFTGMNFIYRGCMNTSSRCCLLINEHNSQRGARIFLSNYVFRTDRISFELTFDFIRVYIISKNFIIYIIYTKFRKETIPEKKIFSVYPILLMRSTRTPSRAIAVAVLAEFPS